MNASPASPKKKYQDESRIVSFPNWKDALREDTSLPTDVKGVYQQAIISFLSFCKKRYLGASIQTVRNYLEDSKIGDQEKDALRWFFRKALSASSETVRISSATSSDSQPSALVAPEDAGALSWERALIIAVRRAGIGKLPVP
jgi:hypothetical protein